MLARRLSASALACTLIGPVLQADQLIPIEQIRTVFGAAYAGNPDGTEVFDSEVIAAPDFAPFADAAIAEAFAAEADGVGAANQTSSIGSSTVTAYGAGSGGGNVFGIGYGGGDGRASFELTFDLPADADYVLSGFIMATDSGSSSFEFLSDNGIVTEAFAFGPEETYVLDSTGFLPAGRYTLRARADGTGYSDGSFFDFGFGEFDFEFRIEASGTRYCSSVPNSSGSAASIDVAGSLSLADQAFELNAQGLPAQATGIFFYGDQQASVPFGPGLRCVGGSLFRVSPTFQADAVGAASVMLDFTTTAIAPNSTWNFQAWYRDPATGAGAFNTSDAINVTFCP